MSGSSKPADVRFSRRLQVGGSGFRDCQYFPTINDALLYIATLPSGEQPAEDKKYIIELHPGLYPEKEIFLPDYCWMRGIAPSSCYIIGDGVPGSRYFVSTGVGGLFGLIVGPLLGGAPSVNWFSRNGQAVYTATITGAIVGTLKVTANAWPMETFTFTGEATAAAVAATINATGVNVEAIVRFDFVELREKGNNGDITVDKTGTANPVLGFSAVADTENPRPVFTFRKAGDVVVAGSPIGLMITDLGNTPSYFDGLRAAANGVGVVVINGAKVELWQPAITVNSGGGLRMEGPGGGVGPVVTIDGGAVINNGVVDIDDQGGHLRLRATAFGTRTGASTLFPEVHAETIKPLNSKLLFDTSQGDVDIILDDFAEARLIFLTSSSMFALAGGPTRGVIGNAEAWLFPGVGAARTLYGQLYVPNFKYGSGTKFKLRFNMALTAVPGGADKIKFDVNVAHIQGGDRIDVPAFTESFTFNPIVGGPILPNLRSTDLEMQLVSAHLIGGNLVLFDITRNPADPNDTYTADMAVLGVELTFGTG